LTGGSNPVLFEELYKDLGINEDEIAIREKVKVT
jgi:hypothetical protein